jgi:hypothetical protein
MPDINTETWIGIGAAVATVIAALFGKRKGDAERQNGDRRLTTDTVAGVLISQAAATQVIDALVRIADAAESIRADNREDRESRMTDLLQQISKKLDVPERDKHTAHPVRPVKPPRDQ